MSLKSLFVRFTLIYITFSIILGTVLKYFDIEAGTSVKVGILIVSVLLSCDNYLKKNNRYFLDDEIKIVIMGFSLINIILETSFSLITLIEMGFDFQLTHLLMGIAVAAFLETIFIYFIVKKLVKNPFANKS